MQFVELCPHDTPPIFLRLAFYCCTVSTGFSKRLDYEEHYHEIANLFDALQYDPKSRPTFNEITKKLSLLTDKLAESVAHPCAVPFAQHPPAFLLSANNHNINHGKCTTASSGAFSNAPLSSTASSSPQPSAPASQQRAYNHTTSLPNRNIEHHHNSAVPNAERSNSLAMPSLAMGAVCTTSLLNHRRSLSENVIMFPPHTTPSDKARCHLLNRHNGASGSSPTMSGETTATASQRPSIPEEWTTSAVASASTRHSIATNGHCNGDTPSNSAQSSVSAASATPCPNTPDYPPVLPANMSLRKVAETMFLKDPQYKPRLGDAQASKSNPFTTLAQLRGVKKILGANPSTYTAGVGDLFSSCFEMSSPFLRELSVFQKNGGVVGSHKHGTNGGTGGAGNGAAAVVGTSVDSGLPKSLPTSPTSVRRDFVKLTVTPVTAAGARTTANSVSATGTLERDPVRTQPALPIVAAKNTVLVDGFKKQQLQSASVCETTATSVASESIVNDSADPMKTSTGSIKKFKAKSLFAHPLFKGVDATSDGGDCKWNLCETYFVWCFVIQTYTIISSTQPFPLPLHAAKANPPSDRSRRENH